MPDAPCGAGRIAIYLARAGCKVTGIDLKKSFTDRATARFQNENQCGQFLTMDLQEMVFSNEFHLTLEGIGPNYGSIKNGDSWK